jgi:hypothetical protein
METVDQTQEKLAEAGWRNNRNQAHSASSIIWRRVIAGSVTEYRAG